MDALPVRAVYTTVIEIPADQVTSTTGESLTSFEHQLYGLASTASQSMPGSSISVTAAPVGGVCCDSPPAPDGGGQGGDGQPDPDPMPDPDPDPEP